MLDEFAGAEDLAEQAELLLEGVPRGDLVRGCVRAEEVPGVEAGKVLEDAHELVATEGGGHVAQVVRYRGVVDEGVGDHDGDGDGDVWMIGLVAMVVRVGRVMRQVMMYGITVSPVKSQQLLMGEKLKAWIKRMNGDGWRCKR